jgi:uncharacterized membrane protein
MSTSRQDGISSFLPPQRIETLTDGVLAIVMTLMVFQFSIPLVAKDAVEAELLGKLLGLLPRFYSYVLSFLILTMNWNGHHFMFHFIKRSDGTLVLINTFWLMFVALIPFSTSLMGTYYMEQIPIVVYGINNLLIFTASSALSLYAMGKYRLVDSDIDPRLLRKRNLLIGPLISLFFIGVSFLSVPVTYIIMFLGGGLSAVFMIRGYGSTRYQ